MVVAGVTLTSVVGGDGRKVMPVLWQWGGGGGSGGCGSCGSVAVTVAVVVVVAVVA